MSLSEPISARQARKLPAYLLAVVIFLAGYGLPQLLEGGHLQSVLNNGLITGILALGVAFVMHQSGLVLFGIATFYGAAAYVCAIGANSFGLSAAQGALLGVALSTLLAFGIGAVIVRVQPLAFMMICLSLGELMRHLVGLPSLRSYTGGTDGMVFMAEGHLFGIDAMDMLDPAAIWPLIWSAVWVAAVGFYAVAVSRYGTRLRAITENEERMRFCGFNTYWPRVLTFTATGFVASLAGVLQLFATGLASPEMFGLITSTNALLSAITGGVSSVAGPILGGVIYTWAIAEFGALGFSQLFTGIAVILVVLLIPRGLLPVLRRLITSKG